MEFVVCCAPMDLWDLSECDNGVGHLRNSHPVTFHSSMCDFCQYSVGSSSITVLQGSCMARTWWFAPFC